MKIDNTWIGTLLRRFYNSIEIRILNHYKDVEFIKRLMREEDFRFFPSEILLIKNLSKLQQSVEGDYIEVGVYRGCSGRMIAETKGKKKLYLIDIFEGLPKVAKIDKALFGDGMFKGNFKEVKKKFESYDNVFIYKGEFPYISEVCVIKCFSFVHLDLDIYKSTKEALDFFYDKVQKGGIILTHDYPNSRGVKKAFDEFFKNKPEKIIEVAVRQAMVIKE